MLLYDTKKYGSHMAIGGGRIAGPGDYQDRHAFGGTSWSLHDPDLICGGPTLLLTLDLSDPQLTRLRSQGLPEIALASYVNCSAWVGRQVFRLDPSGRRIVLVSKESRDLECLPEELKYPLPLPETRLTLRPMSREDLPLDEDSYWRLCDEFCYGPAFIRILGPPIWMQWVQEENCSCGARMEYIAGLGPEGTPSERFLQGRAFSVGDAALYFFFCRACLEVVVASQPI